MTADPTTDAATAEVHERELARRAAMMQADTAALDDLLEDEVRWIHGSGHIDDKRSFIDTIGAGRTRYLALDGSDEGYRRLADDVVLARCVIRMRSEAGGVARDPLTLCNTLVWHRTDGVWRIANYQSTLLV